MENFLEGGISELESAKASVIDLGQKEQACRELDKTLKARQKELEIQKKRVEEKINSSIKKSRAELDKEYDGQIASAEKVIKEAEIKKKNAKAAAICQRMKDENSTLVDENKVLEAEIAANFKEAKVPAICRNRFYYSLFQPANKMDIIVCAIAVLVCAGVIPFIVTRFVSTAFLAVLVWIIIVIFFAAVYFGILSFTKKGARQDELIKARPHIQQIAANKSSIKKRNKNIKADPDESRYNLEEYDYQISIAKEDYNDIKNQKEAAVKNFEEIESADIRTRMEAEYASTIEDIERTIKFATDEFTAKSEDLHEAEQIVAEYKSHLGEKNIKLDKLDELIAIINEGRASTISGAIEEQKNK